MYKVLLVDDERIILEGISKIIDWASLDTQLWGTARHGIEALERIAIEQPDIVITDIRMPGMDGLQLVERIHDLYPEIRMIMLSGFNEFEFARKAMLYGVKHYLLKPCSEQSINQALSEVVEELKQSQSEEQFIQRIQSELTRVLPHAKEQFLKEMVTNKTYGKREWDNFRSLFGIQLETMHVRLALFQAEGQVEYEHLFAVMNIAEDIVERPHLLLGTTIGERVLLLIHDELSEDELIGVLEQVRFIFKKFYKMDMTIALSDSGEITEARSLYRETMECLNHRFYLGEGGLITNRDITQLPEPNEADFTYDEDKLCMLVKSGRSDEVTREINELFEAMIQERLQADTAKTHVTAIYMAIIRQGLQERLPIYMKDLTKLLGLDTLHALKDFLRAAALEITLVYYEANRNKHSSIIAKVLGIIHDNLGNPLLSLHWVAGEMLYMNSDYLGKLFKKELGDKFSNYVTKVRMDKAIEWINQSEDVKVFELADRLGYGDNPQYFGQVFKKYTGFTPTEFKRAP
jgi:two-component system response regulator YesN